MSATITNHTTILFTIEQANDLVIKLNADDEEWTYVAKHDPTGRGFSFIEITDEDGFVLGNL